ncbi:hypothetical protein BF17_02890 [Yersinia similis]|uniref:Uncharacterized protein n=1 Tax=Yersinia similis TaxID=367190 RepID=A0ABM5Q4E3_9GAMM|nr:hypothetical protein BF17_02890 [Yersinia similis]CFQ63229.1 baseplate assembly protein V [Yersinia similis]CNB99249.1 baseplate assembly protein V [Yersinia similis]
MSGDIEHSGGQSSSNGVVVDNHNHGGILRGSDYTEGLNDNFVNVHLPQSKWHVNLYLNGYKLTHGLADEATLLGW